MRKLQGEEKMTYEIEHVNLKKQEIPDDYHCDCDFCKEFGGVLIREDGTKYNKLERRKYYDTENEKTHIAKTPLHVARWAIQEYSDEAENVLDPTMGAGTTAVEALMQKRNAFGVEIQFIDVIKANIAKCNPYDMHAKIYHGDARGIADYFRGESFDLIINNPPYSGDENQTSFGGDKRNMMEYDKTLAKNLAFMKENEAYWGTMSDIYRAATRRLKVGGRLVIGVKDMVKNKAPFLIHKHYGEGIMRIEDMRFEKMVLLPHYPTTLFMNTYNKRFPDVKVPQYQTILVFIKV